MIVVQYGSASARLTCPHYDDAVPSSTVYVQILDGGGTQLLATTAATCGTLSTTLTAAALAGASSVTVATSSSASVGEPIVVAHADGRSEVHTVAGVSTSTIRLDYPLTRAYPSTTTTVKSAHIYYDADLSTTSTYVQDTYYQAEFFCSSWSKRRNVLFRVFDGSSENPIRVTDLVEWFELIKVVADDYDGGDLERARDWAWKDLCARLRAEKHDPDALRDTEELRHLGGGIAVAHFCFGHNMPDRAELLWGKDGQGNIIGRKWGELQRVLLWYDTDGDKARETYETQRTGGTPYSRGL